MAKRVDRTREEAILAASEARLLELLADVQEKRRKLTGSKRSPTVEDVEMPTAHRVAISRASGFTHPVLDAAKAAGVASTMAELARVLGVTKSFLSQVVAGKKPMPAERAAEFQRLTGKRWPQ